MVVLAVRCVLEAGVATQVFVDVCAPAAELLRACVGLPVQLRQTVGAHSGKRTQAADGSLQLVHDARRPLTPPGLVTAVVHAVQHGHPAAVPALPLTDTVKLVDGEGFVRGSPARDGLRVVQSPRAWRSDAAVAHLVPGDPRAFAVRTEWDLDLAEQLL
ncbi:MAG TPA: 2-C-methyl-D-erythritol 4-phosphate cytidylyltransferase [Pseudonocardia sp.]